jgi:eukaryotic-like serine/threonine-protein kinase
MSAVSTVSEVVERIRKSGLVPPDDLNAFLADSASAPVDEDAKSLLARCVDSCLLTKFQAERIAAGKYKGFYLGGYVILDQIGAGGMGQVYLAEHTSMRRLVAVKVLHLPVLDDVIARERFIREARAAAALNHPNIVRVFDLNREGKMLYLVMEFVEGVTLQHWISKQGRLNYQTAANYIIQIAQALQHAFECGLVHRDVKPANLLVDRQGVARLLDLGLARSDSESESKITGKIGSSILGTADYLAPEQAIDSHNVDIRADIYSLGATLYFLLSGQVMFPEGRTAQKLMFQQWKEPTPIAQLVPEVPEGLAAVLVRSIAKKREERFQTPSEFAEALMPYADVPTTPPFELLTTAPKRRWPTRVVDPNASMSNFKLDLSPAQSALSGSSPGTPGIGDSRTRLNGPGSAVGSSSAIDTKPNSKPRLTPITVPNTPRPVAEPRLSATAVTPVSPTTAETAVNAAAPTVSSTALPTSPEPRRGSILPLVWAGLGTLFGLVIAAVVFLLFAK